MVRIPIVGPERTMHTTVKVKLELEWGPLAVRDDKNMEDMMSKESSPISRTSPRDKPFGLYQGQPFEWSYLSPLEFTLQHYVPLMMDMEFQVHACPPGF